MSKITILIADDHEVVREGLKALLVADPNLQIVGEAGNGEQAVSIAVETRPDVVLMDIAMPVMNGKLAAIKIRKRVPSARVVVLSSYRDEEVVREMVFAGAAGFVVKHSSGDELLTAIHAAVNGRTFFSPCIMDGIRHQKRLEDLTGKKAGAATRLSERETQVLKMVAQGNTNRRIGILLGISAKTVEKHRQSFMEKLGIHETAGLTRYAVQKGLVSPQGVEEAENQIREAEKAVLPAGPAPLPSAT